MSQEILHPEIDELQSAIDKFLKNRQQLKVLEAGCGSASYIQLGEKPYMVGIDISEKQLARNNDLNEKIVGDLQTYDLPNATFDVIVCWNVLEHLPSPELALKNFTHAIKEDGIIIIAVPNVSSVWGLITKYTPHGFHTWVYRNIFGEKRAGTDDFGPFQTFSKASIAPEAIKQFALTNGLSIEYFKLYENFRQVGVREKVKVVGPGWDLVKGMTKLFSFGKIDPENTDYLIVMKKPKASAANFT